MKRLRYALVAAGVVFLACGGDTEPGPEPTYVDCVHTTTEDYDRRDTDTLPVGACRPSEPVCYLTVRDPCPCNGPVPGKYYACSCKSGAWACELYSQDAGICGIAMDGGCISGVYDAGTD
jgi:hypothetical protein